MDFKSNETIYSQIIEYIKKQILARGYPPAVREICEAVHLRSTSSVHSHLETLEKNGYIRRDPTKPRAIEILDDEFSLTRRELVNIPVVGNVAAGSPILAEECIEDYLTFDTGGRPGEYFALRVRGESMLKAGILPGDLVVVHRQSTARHGEIVVAMIGDEATVKRLSLRGGQVWLMPENDDYSPIDGTYAQILGRVAAVVRRY